MPHRNQAPEGIASAVPAQDHATFDRSSWPAGLESIVCKPPALHQITLPAQPPPSPHQPPDPILRPSSLPAQKQTPSQNDQKRYPGDTPKRQKEPRQAQGPFGEVGRYPQEPKISAATCFCGIGRCHLPIMFYTHRCHIKLAICFCGIARSHVSIMFYTCWGNIELASCFCGIAQTRVLHWVLHGLGQYQTSDSLLQDRPSSCVVLCFT